jgi:hypothetical protein
MVLVVGTVSVSISVLASVSVSAAGPDQLSGHHPERAVCFILSKVSNLMSIFRVPGR